MYNTSLTPSYVARNYLCGYYARRILLFMDSVYSWLRFGSVVCATMAGNGIPWTTKRYDNYFNHVALPTCKDIYIATLCDVCSYAIDVHNYLGSNCGAKYLNSRK